MIEIVNIIVSFIQTAGAFLGLDIITLIAFGVTLLTFLICGLITIFSVENRTNKKVKEINNYLEVNPFVNDENIVEFNRIMKRRIPRSMRYQWQRYMVNREQKPSEYLSEDNCLTKPFRTSAFVRCLKQMKYIIALICVFAFTFGLGAIYNDTLTVGIILQAAVCPLIITFATAIVLIIFNSKRNLILNDLFYNFDNMQHLLDRAVTTFPAFVDYAILFTRKEIQAGIPALQEYLQQRAEYEQAELEKARLSQVDHEKYDFSKLGIKGSMIMDRAMKECEFYLGNRKILMTDIDSLQNQKDLLTKNYEEKNRGNLRKTRDIKDNIDRLREKLNNTTNKIVGNDIIKQQADEAKKLQQVESEMEEDTNHYNEDIKKLENQIVKKREEIENNRQTVEKILTADFGNYSNEIYEKLKELADSQVKEQVDTLTQENDALKNELEDREQLIVEKDALLNEAADAETLYAKVRELEQDIEFKNQEIVGANKEVESRNAQILSLEAEVERLKREKYHEVYRYFDNNGVEFFYDNVGEPYYYGNDGEVIYYTEQEKKAKLKNIKPIGEGTAKEEAILPQEPVVVPAEEPVEEPVQEQEKEQQVEEVAEQAQEQPKEEPEPQEEKQEEQEQKQEVEEENELASLEEQIARQNEELEQSHNELQQQIENAKKVMEESEDRQTNELELSADELASIINFDAEEPAMEQPAVEPVKEKPAKEKPAPKAEKPKKEAVAKAPKKEAPKKPKAKKKDGPKFTVKKSPTQEGFDLDGFNMLNDKKKK